MKTLTAITIFGSTVAEIFDIPAGGHTGRLAALSNLIPGQSISDHGCWCSKIDGEDVHKSKNTIDTLDQICRDWQAMRSCIYLTGGACHNLSGQDAYSITDDRVCENDNECAQEACQIDAQFIGFIQHRLDQGDVPITIPAGDSACPNNKETATFERKCAGRYPYTMPDFVTYSEEIQIDILDYDWNTNGCPSKDELTTNLNTALPEELQVTVNDVLCASLHMRTTVTSASPDVTAAVTNSIQTIVSVATQNTVQNALNVAISSPPAVTASNDCIYDSVGGFINSPNYDSAANYQNNQECGYTFTHPNSQGKYKVEFIGEFEIETTSSSNGNHCPYDWIKINEVKYCGATTPDEIITNGADLNIIFHSDFSVSKRGFKLKVTELAVTAPEVPSNCGGSKYPAAGETFTSINYPDNYDNHALCTWQLNAQNAVFVKIDFTAFDTENHSSCKYDHLQIGQNKYCGSDNPGPIYADSGVFVNFFSDSASTRTGFSASFQPFAVDTGNNACGKPSIIEGSGSLVQSGYENNIDCKTIFTTEPKNSLRYRFTMFELENHASCGHDSLTVIGKSENQKYCGQGSGDAYPNLNSWVYVSSPFLEFHLVSDFSKTFAGYSIDVEVVEGILTTAPPTTTRAPIPVLTGRRKAKMGRRSYFGFGYG